MGTWGHRVGEDDAFADVYDCFFDHYNSGMSPDAATQRVTDELAEVFADYDDTHQAHFALALAQWETQALDTALLLKVKEIVSSGADHENWAGRGASKATLDKRRKALDGFLKKISKQRRVKKQRVKQLHDYSEHVLIKLPSPDGLKTLTVTESYMDGEFRHTSGMVMWADGGCGIFHVSRSGLECSAKWHDAKNLEIKFSNALESEFDFGIGNKREAFLNGDRVALTFLFV